MATSEYPRNVLAFPGTYSQTGPYEYDNRAFTPEDMDEHSDWVGRRAVQLAAA